MGLTTSFSLSFSPGVPWTGSAFAGALFPGLCSILYTLPSGAVAA